MIYQLNSQIWKGKWIDSPLKVNWRFRIHLKSRILTRFSIQWIVNRAGPTKHQIEIWQRGCVEFRVRRVIHQLNLDTDSKQAPCPRWSRRSSWKARGPRARSSGSGSWSRGRSTSGPSGHSGSPSWGSCSVSKCLRWWTDKRWESHMYWHKLFRLVMLWFHF